jgi:hypothetical protein
MYRKSGVLIALILISAVCSAQCKNQITLVPLPAWKGAKKARDFVRFTYPLTATDSLLVYAHDDPDSAIGSYDTGFAITRDQKVLQRVFLRKLPVLRGDSLFAQNSGALTITRVCSEGSPIYFVTMQYEGDITSPELFLIAVPTAQDYVVSALPMVHGGVLDVSKSDPLKIRTWDNLFEGNCNACDTHYRITEYQIQSGKPVRTRRYRTRRLYSSDDKIFDDRRRVRFIP